MTELTNSELASIAQVMAAAGVEPQAPLSASLIAKGRSNLTFRLSDGLHEWVMRTPPRAGRTPSAHDVVREFRVTSALSDSAVPVPRAVALCEDEALLGGPFAIAEFVPGSSVQSQGELDALDNTQVDEAIDALVQTLAALHSVDHVAVGLERFGRPDQYAERQLRRWSGQWELVGNESLKPLATEIVDALGRDLPRQAAVGIVHGDFRIDNTLLSIGSASVHITAVVDWELSTIGDPVADVAMMCAYRDRAFDLVVGSPSAWTSGRLPSVDEIARAYESSGGVDLVDWENHLALACFKVAVIAAGIAHRVRLGAAQGPGFDTAGDAVVPYLNLARRFLRRSAVTA